MEIVLNVNSSDTVIFHQHLMLKNKNLSCVTYKMFDIV